MRILLLTNFTFNDKLKNLLNILLGKRHGGEMVVLRSLRSGLRLLGHDVDCMPKHGTYYDICHVISGRNSWKWAILNRNKFAFFIAGPNLITLPYEISQFPGRHMLNLYLQPCQWACELFVAAKEFLNIRVSVWACGVNSQDWAEKNSKKNFYLIYIKNNLPIVSEITHEMDKLSINYKTIFYGSYSKIKYKKLLSESIAMIYISESESQGVALLEAWSCNVPTYVFRAIKYYGDSQVPSSAAPYLEEKCGDFFMDVKELINLLINNIIATSKKPRAYVLQNFTDEICAKKYLEVIFSEK